MLIPFACSVLMAMLVFIVTRSKLARELVFGAALFTSSPLFADCGTRACAPVYHAQQTYANNYVATPTYHNVDYPQQIINQTIFYEVGPEVRYPTTPPAAIVAAQIGQYQREAQRLQDKMTDLMQYQRQYQQPQQPPAPQIVYVPYPAPPGATTAAPGQQPQQPMPQPQPAPVQPPPQQPQQPAYSMRAGSVIEAKCAKCHSGANPKGDVDLTRAITCAQYHAAMQRLLTDDASQRMPKGQPPLSPEETAAVMKELTAMTQPGQQASNPAFAASIAAMIDPVKK